MEPTMQQSEIVNTDSSEATGEVSESLTLPMLPPARQTQWQLLGEQFSNFLAQLPDYIGKFFSDYRQPLTSVAFVLAAIVALRTVLAILDALDDIPLLSPLFKAIGIVYSTWFINRYLLRASSRQELSRQLESLKSQIVGSQEVPESQS
jgi:hypothetical protein